MCSSAPSMTNLNHLLVMKRSSVQRRLCYGLLCVPDQEGIDAPFNKDTSVRAIVEDELEKDSAGRVYSEIKEQTNVILSNLYEQFTDSMIQEEQRGTLSSEQSVVIFNDWVLNFMSDQQHPYPIKCHFVSFFITEYLEHVNATYMVD